MRKGLVDAIDSEDSSEYVKTISNVKLNAFNKHFGNGAAGTVAFENAVEGEHRGPKGVPMVALIASFLDPCMKGGVGVSPADQDAIYLVIRDKMIMIAREGAAFEGDLVVAERNGAEARRHHNQDNANIFDEINQHYHDQQQQCNSEHVHENKRGNLIEELIDAELTLYQQHWLPAAPHPLASLRHRLLEQ
jgi:hypothetical protein